MAVIMDSWAVLGFVRGHARSAWGHAGFLLALERLMVFHPVTSPEFAMCGCRFLGLSSEELLGQLLPFLGFSHLENWAVTLQTP